MSICKNERRADIRSSTSGQGLSASHSGCPSLEWNVTFPIAKDRTGIGRDRSEYFVPVRWLHSVPLDQAVNEIGMFGNQNTVCKPTTPKWRTTVERLKERWRIG